MPLVSVCIPTYNYARFLPRTVESVLAQTHSELEVVVLDDLSTDDTAAVMERYLGDWRLRFERNPQNLGLFGNFNRCFEVAAGDFVKVLCADDWLHPSSVEDALEALARSPAAGMATSPAWHVDASDRVIGMVRAPFGREPRMVSGREAIRAHADWGNVAGMPSHVLLRRSVVEEVGVFEPRFAPASDVHLWLKVLARHDLAWVPEPRCYIRLHDEHDHHYDYAADESVFSLWEDMATREPKAVDGPMLKRALAREAQHHLLYVVARLAKRDVDGARALIATMGRHVALSSALARFAAAAPAVAYRQALRLLAVRTGRQVLYDPAPRPGPRMR